MTRTDAPQKTERRQIINPSEEFLIVRHSYLNGNSYDLEKTVEDALSLERYTNGRRVVPCLEGDLIQIDETGEIVLTHQNFFRLSLEKYQNLRAMKIAASLPEILDKVLTYRAKNPDQRVILCFEPKTITTGKTIERAVKTLANNGISDAYFDSFFADKLTHVEDANNLFGTDYAQSLHLVMNISRLKIAATARTSSPDIITVPKKMSVGSPGEPVIYGAVGSIATLEEISRDHSVHGAYLRLTEGEGPRGALKMLWNSVTNTEKLRRTMTVCAYSS